MSPSLRVIGRNEGPRGSGTGEEEGGGEEGEEGVVRGEKEGRGKMG